DATLGLGGHSEAILERNPTAMVVGIDQDENAVRLAQGRLNRFGDRFRSFHANFSEIIQVAKEASIEKADGIIADLGVSSVQLDDPKRGFSFRYDAPLDMRMDVSSDRPTAAELLETLDEEEIANLIYKYGEERKSRRIAKRIVERRDQGRPVRTTADLASLIEKAIGRSPKDKIHPATRTFQALRIAVNDELGILGRFIENSVDLLKEEGRLCVITFHSLEDRIVKRVFQKLSGKCQCPPRIPKCVCGASKRVEVLTRKPIIPTDTEMNENPRSRSAKLRVCQKLSEN
ncbi:MAG TPA: 16S rRNA (cytosine(1402)-N(4))-methyltransferase RsmH, partial [Pyrinomonadaceae bacterium]|nr:16S rRNA (cytosine(1402)-N(4))-methyltransferase RsmH [Pyrinomonadaceae bacterium]